MRTPIGRRHLVQIEMIEIKIVAKPVIVATIRTDSGAREIAKSDRTASDHSGTRTRSEVSVTGKRRASKREMSRSAARL